jgi:hypothetical protein
MPLGGLDRRVTEIASVLAAQLGAVAAEVVGAEVFDPDLCPLRGFGCQYIDLNDFADGRLEVRWNVDRKVSRSDDRADGPTGLHFIARPCR